VARAVFGHDRLTSGDSRGQTPSHLIHTRAGTSEKDHRRTAVEPGAAAVREGGHERASAGLVDARRSPPHQGELAQGSPTYAWTSTRFSPERIPRRSTKPRAGEYITTFWSRQQAIFQVTLPIPI
jgi:hypothetical protein